MTTRLRLLDSVIGGRSFPLRDPIWTFAMADLPGERSVSNTDVAYVGRAD